MDGKHFAAISSGENCEYGRYQFQDLEPGCIYEVAVEVSILDSIE